MRGEWGRDVRVGTGCWGSYGSCFAFRSPFPCAWVGPVDLLLRDLIVRRCRPTGGGPPYLNVNAGCLTIKKKKKKISYAQLDFIVLAVILALTLYIRQPLFLMHSVHGDLLAMSWKTECPFLLTLHTRGLSSAL